MWEFSGGRRPDFAATPSPGQESVWDYPRPPALVRDDREVTVMANGAELARSRRCFRVLETASPPTWYVPAQDVAQQQLLAAPGSSFCEWKGAAIYWCLAANPTSEPVAWSYPEPARAFAELAGAYAFYPGRVECFVDGERVRPQPGHFYGGWVTDDIAGPWKGEPGTGHW